MNAENNDLHEEMTEADSGAAAKTSAAATEVQDHHVKEAAVEAEDATSVTAADETEAIDAAAVGGGPNRGPDRRAPQS